MKSHRPNGTNAINDGGWPLGRRFRLRRAIVVVGLVAIASPQPARAQFITNYFPAFVAGIGGGPSGEVLARPRTDYDFRGVRAGDFIIRPNLTESFGHDANVTGLSHGPGSTFLQTDASVGATSDWERDSLNAYLSLSDLRYFDQPTENQTNWTASLAGSHRLGDDQIGLAYTHLHLNESPRDIDAPTFTGIVPYDVDDARLSYSAVHGRITLVPNIDATAIRFSNPSGTSGASQSFRDRNLVQGELASYYELSPLRNLVAVVRGTHIGYLHAQSLVPDRSSNGGTFLIGLDYAAADVFRYRALIGYQFRQYDSRQYSNLSAPIIEAAVTWTPTQLTTVTGTLLRDIEDSSSETLSGYTYSLAKLSVDHEYLRNLLLNAYGEYQRADYAASTQPGSATVAASSQTILGAGVGATWLLNRRMRLGVTYDYSNRHAPAPGSYTDHVYLLRLTFGL
jgi:hypothetical protein